MARLTAKGIEAVRAADDRRELADDYMRGLYLVVQPTGSKSWAVRYRHGGRSHKHTVGPYPAFDLKQARDAAAKVLRAVAEGRRRSNANPVASRTPLRNSSNATAGTIGQSREARPSDYCGFTSWAIGGAVSLRRSPGPTCAPWSLA